jgi:putative methionine-R-sulfoxide reductase with GAF domain
MMAGSDPAQPLSLPDLIDRSRWQRLQDHFVGVLGIAIRTVSAQGELLVNPSWPGSVEVERTIRLLRIGEEFDELLPPGAAPQEGSTLTTPLGITYATVPIRASPEQVVAYFVVGPVVVGPRESEQQFRQRVTPLGIDAGAVWPLILSLKLYTFTGIRSALKLIEEAGTLTVELAYEAQQAMRQVVASGPRADRRQEVLSTLLEAAMRSTQADGGSVMVYDRECRVLRLALATGLGEAAMAAAPAGLGEGIAGLAMAERRILLVDDQVDEPRVRERMRRPELVSSLVAPLVEEADREPIGVLSLRSADPQRRFTQHHVEILRRLLDLSTVAFQGFFPVRHTLPSTTS